MSIIRIKKESFEERLKKYKEQYTVIEENFSVTYSLWGKRTAVHHDIVAWWGDNAHFSRLSLWDKYLFGIRYSHIEAEEAVRGGVPELASSIYPQ